jgi:ankyrin repeat protein
LHLACRNGYADIVHILLQHGADVDSRCNEDLTPLYSACFYGHTEVARQLLLHNASVNCRNKRNGYTPLLLAARNNHHDLLKVLLADNVDGSSSQIDGRSALHWTCYHGNIEITKLLMTRGLCCPNARDSIGNTPLHYACQRGMSTVVYYMIQTGSVNVEIKNNDGKLPRDLAVQSDNLELMMFLV